MDGSLPVAKSAGSASRELSVQHTLKSPISCRGTALHSGRTVQVRLCPAAPETGLVFHRTDLGVTVPARFDYVVDTRLCTVLAVGDARIGTVEHLMAALHAAGVTNLLIEVDGPELPVLDGSAEPWAFLIDCAGLLSQDLPAAEIEVLRVVRAGDGHAYAELRPTASTCLELNLSIEFDAPAIGRQALGLALHGDAFREVAPARTFTQAHEIDGLRDAGLAQGGTLDNAVVVDGPHILNPAGLRMPDEFVRHKLLDAVGDLALAGAALHGRFVGHRSGHALNNQVLRALFADQANWRLVPPAARNWSRLGETAAAA